MKKRGKRGHYVKRNKTKKEIERAEEQINKSGHRKVIFGDYPDTLVCPEVEK